VQNNCIANPNALPVLAWSKVPAPSSLVGGIKGARYRLGKWEWGERLTVNLHALPVAD
jgi:hypothetical protein